MGQEPLLLAFCPRSGLPGVLPPLIAELGLRVRRGGDGWVMNALIIIIAYDVGGSNPAPATMKTLPKPLST